MIKPEITRKTEQENNVVISKVYREDRSWNGIDQESLKIVFGYLSLNSTVRYSLLSIKPPQDACTTYVLEGKKKRDKWKVLFIRDTVILT